MWDLSTTRRRNRRRCHGEENRAAHKKTEQSKVEPSRAQSRAEHNSAGWHTHVAGGRARRKSRVAARGASGRAHPGAEAPARGGADDAHEAARTTRELARTRRSRGPPGAPAANAQEAVQTSTTAATRSRRAWRQPWQTSTATTMRTSEVNLILEPGLWYHDRMEVDLLKGAKGHHMYMYNMQKHPCAI
jgi:hypothetical protein